MDTLTKLLEYFKVDPTGIGTDARRLPIDIPAMDREDLAGFFGWAGLREGAEIGVERGAFSEVLCKNNPDGHLRCVDAWKAYYNYREHVSQDKLDGFFESTQERLKGYNVTFLRHFSVRAAREVQDRSLDYVYIDANHTLPYVIEDLRYWIPKVRVGGIISGHDYCRRSNGAKKRYQVHVVEAIMAWTGSYGVNPWFVIGRKDARPDERRDRPRSWMWVKADEQS